MNYAKQERIRKSNGEWLKRDKPKRQSAKDNAWKMGSVILNTVRKKK